MSQNEDDRVTKLMDTPQLADALESDRFKQFLDNVPIAIAVSELQPSESVTYVNLEFERLVGRKAAEIEGKSWQVLPGVATGSDNDRKLREAVADDEEYLGTFTITRDDGAAMVDAWSNTIENDAGTPMFRLVALVELGQRDHDSDEAARLLRDKDVLLQELQHRVKNNLQMITALIRLEARNVPDGETGERFDRLAGRINSLALLYNALAGDGFDDSVDLGIYLSQIASSVMQAHASEGIRLDMKVDTWPVSINVAMPTGLVVNELLINALKHAFVGRDGGTIKLHSLVDETGCRVTIADDGIGLPEDVTWPKPGKLSAVIAHSLERNAKAKIDIDSRTGEGLCVTIIFEREAAAPEV